MILYSVALYPEISAKMKDAIKELVEPSMETTTGDYTAMYPIDDILRIINFEDHPKDKAYLEELLKNNVDYIEV